MTFKIWVRTACVEAPVDLKDEEADKILPDIERVWSGLMDKYEEELKGIDPRLTLVKRL